MNPPFPLSFAACCIKRVREEKIKDLQATEGGGNTQPANRQFVQVSQFSGGREESSSSSSSSFFRLGIGSKQGTNE